MIRVQLHTEKLNIEKVLADAEVRSASNLDKDRRSLVRP